MLRLDKYLADVGIGTRSEVKKYLKYGLVSVNGSIVKDSSLKVDTKKDKVTYKGEDLLYQEYRYYILNKPAGCVSATKDGLSQTVIEILKNETTRDLFPVGRLDKDTEGLLLITNDGKLAHNLLSPKKHVDKSYIAFVDKALEEKQLLEFKQGLDIGDETHTLPCEIKLATENEKISSLKNASFKICEGKNEIAYIVVLKEGRYHQVKRMFEHFDSTVIYLKRLTMGNLSLSPTLPIGHYRALTDEEIQILKER